LNDAWEGSLRSWRLVFTEGLRGLTCDGVLIPLRVTAKHQSVRLTRVRHGPTGEPEQTRYALDDLGDERPETTLNVTVHLRRGTRFLARARLDPGSESNTYALQTTSSHMLTRRPHRNPTVRLTYQGVDLLDSRKNAYDSYAYRRLPDTCLYDRTLNSPSVTAGPSITQLAGETSISPGGSAVSCKCSISARLALSTTRGVGRLAEFGGTPTPSTIWPDLSFRDLVPDSPCRRVHPHYRIATSVIDGRQPRSISRALTVPVAVNYQFARYVPSSPIHYFQQSKSTGIRTQPALRVANRLSFGLQFGTR